ncbi:MAG: hypothetical protein RBR07_04820 [Arcobacteraceae bacterium]|jgi:hypothetical protein|nr:hypothetical protein [Arcobacteraceae bacterium]
MSTETQQSQEEKIQEMINKLNDFKNNPNSTMRDFSSLVCCLQDVKLSCPLEDTTTQNET